MRRVVLTQLPGLNYFIGTFDLANYRNWWKSYPLPGAVENIEHGLWVGGPMHLALAKMQDGTWSIFQTYDYGVHWHLVLNHPVEIMDIELVTFTWVLFSDANGDWYESTTSGTDWQRVCTSGPVGKAFFVMHHGLGNEHRVLAHDGRYIWKSIDIARNWTRVADLQSFNYTGQVDIPDGNYTGVVTPAIAGANDVVYASNGPFLVTSNDGGDTFSGTARWDGYYYDSIAGLEQQANVLDLETNKVHVCFPDYKNIHGRRKEFLISDILLSSVDGATPYDVQVLVVTKDTVPRHETKTRRMVVGDRPYQPAGFGPYPRTERHLLPVYRALGANRDFLFCERVDHIPIAWQLEPQPLIYQMVDLTAYSRADSDNYARSVIIQYDDYEPYLTRVYKSYLGKIIYGDPALRNMVYQFFKFAYQQESGFGIMDVSNYQVLNPGTAADYDKLVFSAMKGSTGSGAAVLSLKYSTDGGRTLKDIDLANIKVYSTNPDFEPDPGGGAFTDTDYTNIVWVGPACNNTGHWDTITHGKRQLLSYDIDLFMGFTGTKEYALGARVSIDRSEDYDVGAYLKKNISLPYDLRAYLRKLRTKGYLIAARHKKIRTDAYGLDLRLPAFPTHPYSIRSYLSKKRVFQYRVTGHFKRQLSAGYSLDAWIVESEFNQMLLAVERRIPQLWDLLFPQGSKPIYDSKIDPETD